MPDETAHFFADAPSQPDWARLGQHLPYERTAQAVAYTGRASIRKRRLPAEPVACPSGIASDKGGCCLSVRLEMAKAALEVKCDPTEIGFIRAFHVISTNCAGPP